MEDIVPTMLARLKGVDNLIPLFSLLDKSCVVQEGEDYPPMSWGGRAWAKCKRFG